MEYEIIDFVITVHDPEACFALVREVVLVPRHHLVIVRDGPDGFFGLYVDSIGLCLGHSE